MRFCGEESLLLILKKRSLLRRTDNNLVCWYVHGLVELNHANRNYMDGNGCNPKNVE